MNQATSALGDWDPTIAGQAVRIRANPGHRGVTTGKVRQAGTRCLVQVQFGPNEKVYKPQSLLELYGEHEDIGSLLRQGRWGGADDLRRILTFEKIKGQLTNVFYSMEASQTDFYAHQFKPVLKFLNSPVGRLLIADEVGLGKTIEAMYIWKELQARLDARRLLIVCPAMLRQKWQADLQKRFNIFAEIIDAKQLLQRVHSCLEQRQRSQAFVCIASLEGLRPGKNWDDSTVSNARAELARLLYDNPATEDFALFDLAIFDEAHYLRNPSTANNRIGQLLRDASRHLILLTATPVQVNDDNLFQLMRLISPEDFSDRLVFQQILEANRPVIQALRDVWAQPPQYEAAQAAVATAMQSKYFTQNQVLRSVQTQLQHPQQLDQPTRVELGYRLEKASLLGQYLTRSRKRDVLKNRVKRKPQTLTVEFSLLEQEIYHHITDNIKRQAKGKKGVSVFTLVARQRQMASCMVAALQGWKSNGLLGEFINESLWEDFGRLADAPPEKTAPIDQLTPLIQSVDMVELERHDRKYAELEKFLQDALQRNAQEKVVIFAYFRGTLQYLQRRLEASGISTCLIMGDMGAGKWPTVEQFRTSQGPTVLLSSEVGSEGIDLQHCRVLVNYDLPWNPMRVEQRIGRLDRLGQQAETISIVNFSLVDTVEEKILERLYERIQVFEESIGDLESILGHLTEELLLELFAADLTPAEQQARAEQTMMAHLKQHRLKDELETEAINMLAFSDHILRSIEDSREQGRWLQPTEVRAFVEDCFACYYPGTVIQPQSSNMHLFDISLSEDAKIELEFFLKQHRCTTPTNLHSWRTVACFFDAKLANTMGQRHELLDATHPLILWIRDRYEKAEQKLHPVSALQIQAQHVDLTPGTYVYVIDRWTFAGVKTESRIVYQVACLNDGKLLPATVSETSLMQAMQHGQPKLDVDRGLDSRMPSVFDLYEKCLHTLEGLNEQAMDEFFNENDNRCNVQERSARAFAERKQHELTERIQRFQQAGKTKILPAIEGQLRKVERELEVKLKGIQQKRDDATPERELLAAGVMFVEE